MAKKIIYEAKKIMQIFFVGFAVYILIELFFRFFIGQTTIAVAGLIIMGVLGGVSLVLIGLLNEIPRPDFINKLQVFIGAVIILILELVAGITINHDHQIWTYWGMPWDPLVIISDGQICSLFFLFWHGLAAIAIRLDDLIREDYF